MIDHIYEVTDVTPELIGAMARPARSAQPRRHDACHDDAENGTMAVKRPVRCHGTTGQVLPYPQRLIERR